MRCLHEWHPNVYRLRRMTFMSRMSVPTLTPQPFTMCVALYTSYVRIKRIANAA
jgi:hypothetical protein